MYAVEKRWVVLLVLASACGGSGGGRGDGPGGGDPTTPAAASCTGTVPPNSTACPDAGAGLMQDAPRVVTSACTYPATPCSHVCNAGFVVEVGACVTAPASPTARFSDNGDGTVTVTNAAGALTWLRAVGCGEAVAVGGGTGTWEEATLWSAGLAAGTCALTDGSRQGDWRLPTHVELAHMALDLAAENPFPVPQTGVYWSSWTYWPDKAGGVAIPGGDYFDYPRDSRFLVWPVR